MQGPAEYVYGVTAASAGARVRVPGVADAAVRPLVFGELAALASPVPPSPVRARKRDLTRHADVVAAAFREGPVVPLRFGTVFADADAVVDDFLEPRHDELAGLLRDLDGLAELRVTAFYDEEEVLRDIVTSDRRVAQLREATQGRPAARALQLELGERVAAQLTARADADARAILDELAGLARDAVVEERLAELQVLRASFLVADAERFDRAVDRLARRGWPQLRFKLVGPLAPHSFVSLAEAVG